MSESRRSRIAKLEAEIILASFHQYRVPHYEEELLKLYKEEENDPRTVRQD